jgi:hypothetical protein
MTYIPYLSDVMLYGPVGLSLIALALTAWAAFSFPSLAAEAGVRVDRILAAVRLAEEELVRIAREKKAAADRLAQAESLRMQAAAAASYAGAATSREPFVVPKQKVINPVESKSLEVQDRLESFLDSVKRWSKAAESGLDNLTNSFRGLEAVSSRLPRATSFDQIKSAENEIDALVPELLRAVIVKSDRDIDSKRTNTKLQEALRNLFSKIPIAIAIIDPSPGETVNLKLHRGIGIFGRGDPELRGTVGQVRCRGLRWEDGTVILQAEVLEYD